MTAMTMAMDGVPLTNEAPPGHPTNEAVAQKSNAWEDSRRPWTQHGP